MRILIIGGTRFFGKRLVHQLANAGNMVTVVSTRADSAEMPASVSRLCMDRGNIDSLKSALGMQTWDVVYDQICFDEASALAATELLKGRVGQLVMASTMSVYGYGSGTREWEFNSRTYQGNPNNENPYQEGKRLAERAYSQQDFSL